MRAVLTGVLLACGVTLAGSGDRAEGQREEKRACAICHGLRIIHVQRLSRAAWERELDKMQRWGAVMRNRAALLDYLAADFGERTPPAPTMMSRDGRRSASK